jgi:TolB-like protein/tRNA A-37 threonylcarbamoyl transferase component Bud32
MERTFQDLIGKKVSHYRVLEAIGSGGMGMVFQAEDVKLGRRVALKFLPEELVSDPVALQRFEREAQTASALNHPNICTIYEIEEHEGRPFIAMEFLEGCTLHHCMTTPGPMAFPLAPLVDIAIQVCDGLQAAHDKGIIHRDIKPANLFVTKQGIVKILDFGIAKLTASEEPEEKGAADPSLDTVPLSSCDDAAGTPPNYIGLTRTGTISGSLGYMSPEQVRNEKLDARTDLFSLGLVLYQMASGRRAFSGKTVAAVHDAILNQTPPPAHELNPAVPPLLEAVITRALEKDRARRYQGANEIRTDLRSLRQDTDSDHMAVAAVASAVKRRKLPLWAGIAGAALVVAAILALQLVRVSQGKMVDAIAVLPFVNATNVADNEYLSDGITEDLINTLSELPNVKVVARSTVFRFKGRDEDPAKIGQELRVDAVLTGRVSERDGALVIQTDLIRTTDGTEMWGAQYSRSKPNLMTLRGDIVNEVAARLQAKVSSEQRQEMIKPETRNSEAYDLYLKGRYAWSQRGRENVLASIEDFQQAIVADPAFALAYSGLADAYSIAPPYGVSTPKEAHPLALAAAAKALQLQPNLAEAHAAMGAALAHTRQWEAAEKEFKRSLELNPNNASAHYLYAFETLTPMNRLDEAVPQYRAALEIDPLSPIINGNYGVLLFMRHRYDESMQQLKRTMELQPGFTVTSLRLGDLFALKGDFKNAALQRRAYFPKMVIPVRADAQNYGQATIDAISHLTGYQPDYLTAEAWVWAGDRDKVFEYLKKGCDEEDNLEPVFLRSPSFDPIRWDQRYSEVTKCLRIPQ